MAVEIEHKYLVNKTLWKKVVSPKAVDIMQAYLVIDRNKTIRVRTKGRKAYLAIKGQAVGASRLEYEYEIPLKDAKELIEKFSTHKVEKTRHYVRHGKLLWEVDVFKGLNEGLIMAEIELAQEDQKYPKPNWLGRDVTGDEKYTNAALAIRPFKSW